MKNADHARLLAGVTLILATTSGLTPLEAQELDIIGPDAGVTLADAVSANGAVVIGYSGIITSYGAVRFTSDGGIVDVVDPSLLFPGYYGEAFGVSDAGAAIVGQATFADGSAEAFRQTTGGTERLGFLNGGNVSKAYDVSSDGAIVVGAAHDGATPAQTRAVIWTDGAGSATALDELASGADSEAYGISGDGAIVVGTAGNASYGIPHAAMWNASTGGITDLGVLNGGALAGLYESYAYGVSDDGGVIVGWSQDGAYYNLARAFRWTAEGGMVGIGTFDNDPYSSSKAYDISGDGLVIVGTATASSETGERAFRYTEAGGMQTVEDWLRDNGAVIAADITDVAYGTNCDGSVVVGQTVNDTAFIARVASNSACLSAATDSGTTGGGNTGGGETGGGNTGGGNTGGGNTGGGNTGGGGAGAGIITINDLAQSLGSASAANQTAVNVIGTMLNGAGSRPLDRRVDPGRRLAWATGDLGRDDHGARDGHFALGEIGGGYNFGPVQINAAIGGTAAHQNTQLGGGTDLHGVYGKVEMISPLHRTRDGGIWAIMTAAVVTGDADIRRNYLDNGGLVDTSSGAAGVSGYALRARLAWENAFLHFTPYAEFSHAHSCLGAYTETGGAFPASFNRLCDDANEARYGVDTTIPLTDRVSLTGTIEGVHRFEAAGNGVTGNVAGLGSFSFGAPAGRQDWLRGGVGVETKLGDSILAVTANATTQGESPSLWLSASWRRSF